MLLCYLQGYEASNEMIVWLCPVWVSNQTPPKSKLYALLLLQAAQWL